MSRIPPKVNPDPNDLPDAMKALWEAPVTAGPVTEKGKFIAEQMCYVEGRSAEIVVALGRFGKRSVVLVKSRNRENGGVHRFAMSLDGFGALMTGGQAVLAEKIKDN